MDNNGPGPHTGAIKKKNKKGDARAWDKLFKGMTNSTLLEKLAVAEKYYKEIFNELRSTSMALRLSDKQVEALQKDKERLDSELTKARLIASKMESLARELQKQNKDIKEEYLSRFKDEEQKRKALAASFTEKLNSLNAAMDERQQTFRHLEEANFSMTSSLSDLYSVFQERETHLANITKQLELQMELTKTQQKKLEVEFEAERAVWAKERATLQSNYERSEQANTLLQENINILQSQVEYYKKQYTEMAETLRTYNNMADSIKTEIQKVQKSNIEAEKERDHWKNRYDTFQASTNQTIIRLTAEIEYYKREAGIQEQRKKTLEELCKQLALERGSYINQLKFNNIQLITPGSREDLAIANVLYKSPGGVKDVKIQGESAPSGHSCATCQLIPAEEIEFNQLANQIEEIQVTGDGSDEPESNFVTKTKD